MSALPVGTRVRWVGFTGLSDEVGGEVIYDCVVDPDGRAWPDLRWVHWDSDDVELVSVDNLTEE